MIRALRVRHRFAVAGLALALPPLYGLALAARSPEARNATPLAALLAEPAPPNASGPRAVELDTRETELVPDALVYWSPGPEAGDALAPDSVFLGTLPADAKRTFVAPGAGAGRVVVYSLAWQRIVRALPVAAEPAP